MSHRGRHSRAKFLAFVLLTSLDKVRGTVVEDADDLLPV